MEPYDEEYHTDSGDESAEKFQWPSSNVTASLSARHAALMRDELEISPLVPSVPPMPGERRSDAAPGPGMPSSFKSSSSHMQDHPLLALKKRKVAPDVFDKEADYSSQQAMTLPVQLGSDQAPPADVADLDKKIAALPEPVATDSNKRGAEVLETGHSVGAEAATVAKKMKESGSTGTVELVTPPNIRDIVLGSVSSPKQSVVVQAKAGANEFQANQQAEQVIIMPAEKVAVPAAGFSLPLPAKKKHENQPKKVNAHNKKPGDNKKLKMKGLRDPRKILVAKKEQDQAYTLLRDKDDLLDCLDKADCFFLANQFWIFTVQQLASILLSTDQDVNEIKVRCRDELVTRIVSTNHLTGGRALGAAVHSEGQDNGRTAAEARLAEWREKIEGHTASPVEERFPLDGPIACLFPETTQNFLASVPIKTLLNFLSLKKTESGAICDMFKIWRRLCHLSTLSPLSLAKHLLGVTNRIEFALSALPFVSAKDRQWMSDPIIIMTGAAREFLVEDQGITTARRFVDVRTKNLATNLEVWRERKKLPVLKGSGKVAMISGWKATAREAIDAEDEPGKRLTEDDLEAMASRDVLIVNEEPGVGQAAALSLRSDAGVAGQNELMDSEKAKESVSTDRQLKYALNAQLFLEDVLGKTITKLLSTVDIRTAGALFQASQDDLQRAKLYECMKANEVAKDNVQCKTLLKIWSDKLDKELDQFRPHGKTNRKSRESKVGLIVAKHHASDSSGAKDSNDPFKILSSVTQTFLGSLNIDTARAFLSSRTTDLAEAFVKWRADAGMPVLKGQGAIASVSGWKASCRKAAKMLGLDEVATMEPIGRVAVTSTGKSKKREYKHFYQSTTLPVFMLTSPVGDHLDVSLDHVLRGKNTAAFAVGATGGSQYQFQLQLRRPDVSAPLAIFITYSGETPCSEKEHEGCSDLPLPSVPVLDISGNESEISDLPIMRHATTSPTRFQRFSSFASTLPGMGFIELRRYGVRPVKRQALDFLKQELSDFILSGNEKASPGATKHEEYANIILCRQPLVRDVQYLLYLPSPIEKGQCTELVFPLVESYLKSGIYNDCNFERRFLMEDALHLLCLEDLQAVASYLDSEILTVVDSQAKADVCDIQQVAESRRRLHWVAWQAHMIIDDSNHVFDRLGRLYFGCLSLEKTGEEPQESLLSSPAGSDNQISLNVHLVTESHDRHAVLAGGREEMKKELLALMERDSEFASPGSPVRCPLFTQTFESLQDDFLDAYWHSGHRPSDDELLRKLSYRLQSLLSVQPTMPDCVITCARTDSENLLSVLARLCETNHISLGVAGDEIHNEAKENDSLDVLVCAPHNHETRTDVDSRSKLRTLSSFHLNGHCIDYEWYRKFQWRAVHSFIMGLESLLLSREYTLLFGKKSLLELKELAIPSTESEGLMDLAARRARTLHLPFQNSIIREPRSLPLFLGIVWPALRKMHWRADITDSPTLSYVPPAKNRQDASENSRAKRSKRRIHLARECKDIGLGDIPKLTKRLFVQVCTEHDRSSETKPAEIALQKFKESVAQALKGDDRGVSVMATLVAALGECFKSVAPYLSLSASHLDKDLGEVAEISPDVLSSDYLLRFLLVLPTLLRQCNLSLQVIQDCMDVIQNLVDFLTTEHTALFDATFHPPEEHYAKDDLPVLTDLTSKLRTVHSLKLEPSVSGDDLETCRCTAGALTEVVLEPEKEQLTTFLVRVLEQFIPCRANELDCRKRNRHIHVGFPGFVCRHCLGSYGEGRYFFTTIESLTTASAVVEKHILKCPSVPANIKTEIITSKVDHAEERKHLPTGAQQAFFNRLWDRLRSAEIEGVLSRVHLPDTYKDDVSADDHNVASSSFADHVAVLDYVRTSKQFSSDKFVSDAMTLYYNCLEYGGRVWYTPSQPEHFSAEWLIRKIAPKMQWAGPRKKIRMMPG